MKKKINAQCKARPWTMIVALVLLVVARSSAVEPQAGGILLLSDPLTKYVELVQFTSIREEPLFATVTLRTGGNRQFRKETVIVRIPNPPAPPTAINPASAKLQIETAQKAAAAYPAYKQPLLEIETRWRNSLNATSAALAQIGAKPSTPVPGISIEVKGLRYTDVSLTGFDGNVASIKHDAGVARIAIDNLTAEQIAALNRTSVRTRIVTIDGRLQHAQKLALSPDEFIAYLAKDSSHFPLTRFCVNLQNKEWAAAESLLESSSAEIGLRMRHLGHELRISPLIYIVAAQEPRDSPSEAAALEVCSRVKDLRDRAMAYRVLSEYALKNARLGTAQVVGQLIDHDFNQLAGVDKDKIASGSSEGVSDAAMGVVVQQAIVRRLLVTWLAQAGRNKEALKVGEIRDLGERVTANCEILKGLIITDDPFADEFASMFLQGLAKAGRRYYQIEVLSAQASALSKRGKHRPALELLDKAIALTKAVQGEMPREILTSTEIRLLREKAEVYRKDRDEASASDAVRIALEKAKDARNHSAAIGLADLSPTLARETIGEIRQSWILGVDKDAESVVDRLLAISSAQRGAGDLPGARETLKMAVGLLPRCKRPDSLAAFLCVEQARCADFDGASHTLNTFTRLEDRERLSRTIMIEQAKRGKLKEALATCQASGATDQKLDEIGAATTGILEKVELFPFLRKD